MLKIPTFVLGGLLILTGLTSYFLQAPSLSIKIKGRLADDTKLTFSDGTQTQTAKTVYLSEIESASFQAKEIIESFYGETTFDSIFPAGPASKAAGENIAIDQARMDPAGIKSFWYASSRKDTLEALIQRTENEHNKDPDFEEIPVNWAEVDVNSSTIKFVYVNAAGNSGPATLQISNWKNIDFANPPENNTLEFGKSKTALIPSLIGLILILLVMAAEAKPSARKHIMHLTVLLGLVAFFMLAKMFGPAFAEMTWLRGDPNNSIQHYCTIIKPITMLASAGLLLIFVILCVVSFIQARKEKVAQAKRDSLAKKKAGKGQFEDKEEKKAKGSKGISGSTKSKDGEQNTPKGSNTKNDSSKPQKPGYSGGSTNKPTSSDAKGLPASKSVDKKKGTTVTEEKKDSGKKDIVSKEKPRNKTSDDPEKRKGSEQKSNKDAPTATSKELKETKKKENITDSGTKKTSEEDKGFSYKKTDDKGDNSGVRRDSSEDSPEKK